MLKWGYSPKWIKRKRILVNVLHSSEAASRPVLAVCVCVWTLKHLVWSRLWQSEGVALTATTACHGWSNGGEECEHVNSYNAELCFPLVGSASFSALHPVTVTINTFRSLCLLLFLLCTASVFTTTWWIEVFWCQLYFVLRADVNIRQP